MEFLSPAPPRVPVHVSISLATAVSWFVVASVVGFLPVYEVGSLKERC